jgi:hypothetical protein
MPTTVRAKALRVLMSGVLAISLTSVASAGVDKGSSDKATADKNYEVTTAGAPAGTDARIKRALSDAVRLHIGQSGLSNALRGYSIIPALIQLKRVTGPGQAQPSIVCVVELSVQHSQRGWLATVRGNASSLGATQWETISAAAQAAVARLPDTWSAIAASSAR